MEYIALYRKYRPKSFSEIIGQHNIVTILKNQIIMNKIAHAYLFCGTRGTGKTSAAKIFAKAVNCPNHIEGNPCNTCEVCQNIEKNQIMDIIEIDAASNRGVDEIRELREKVKYPPTLGVYKVYIIDEVHMLTQEAFNALLKTLEEPPKHVIFILATTEPHKLPATILSRCQRFNFKRIESSDMIKNMQHVCKEQKIEVDEKALMLIAQNADGAMRDALSILDQCLSVGNQGGIQYEQVKELLGLSHDTIIYSLAENIIKEDVKSALSIVESAYENGNEMSQLINQLIMCFRDILVYQISKEFTRHYDFSVEHSQWLLNIGTNISKEKLTYIIETLSQMDNKMKYSSLPKILMEVVIIKLCQPQGHVQHKIEVQPVKNQSAPKNDNEVNIQQAETLKSNKSDSKEENNNDIGEKDISKDESNIDFDTLCKYISKEKPLLASALKMGKYKGVVNNTMCVHFNENDSIHLDSAKKHQSFIEEIIHKIYKKDLKVVLDTNNKEEDNFIQLTKTLFGDDKVSIIDNKN